MPPRRAKQSRAPRSFACVGNDDDLRSVVLARTARSPAWRRARSSSTTPPPRRTWPASCTCKPELGLNFIDAPVSGGQAGAVNGALTIMCGGEQAVFDAIAGGPGLRARRHAGGSPGAGQLAKMVNQICIAGIVQGLSEAVAFGQAADLDMKLVLDVISKGAAQSWQMENRGGTMVDDKFDFGFAVDWMRKDLGLVLAEARNNGARLPLTALVDQFYGDVQKMGGGRWDTSSLIKRLRD